MVIETNEQTNKQTKILPVSLEKETSLTRPPGGFPEMSSFFWN